MESVVESIWYARGTVPYAREQISPTGSTVAVLVLGDPIAFSIGRTEHVRTSTGFVVGPHDRPAVNEPTGETFAVGIVSTPIGAEPVFGRAPATLRGQVVDVENVWSDGLAIRRELATERDPEVVLDVLAERLAASAGEVDARRRRCAGWVAALTTDPTLAISTLAEHAELSHAHLVSEFTHHVGITPRAMSRIIRLRRVLAEIDIEPDAAWTDIAHLNGWFDQAHFIRDFKRHTGVTPSAYVAAQRASFSPDQAIAGSGVGFVPET